MANYIDLDSRYRIFTTWPNPCRYTLEGEQVGAWVRAPRTVNAMSGKPSQKVIDFTQSVEVRGLTLPYLLRVVDNVSFYSVDLPRIYLDVHTERFNDLGLISTIDSKINKARFVLLFDFIQNNSSNVPTWVHFKCNQNQVMRFSRNEPIVVNIMQDDGTTLIIDDADGPNASKQTWMLLEVTPTYRSGDYENIGIQMTQF